MIKSNLGKIVVWSIALFLFIPIMLNFLSIFFEFNAIEETQMETSYISLTYQGDNPIFTYGDSVKLTSDVSDISRGLTLINKLIPENTGYIPVNAENLSDGKLIAVIKQQLTYPVSDRKYSVYDTGVVKAEIDDVLQDYYITNEEVSTIITSIAKFDTFVNVGTSNKSNGGIFITVLLSLILLLMFIISKNRQRDFEIGTPAMSTNGGGRDLKCETSSPTITFDDICGCDALKKDVQTYIRCISNPEKTKAMGGRMPKGLLLYGPPGTGKTLIAKAIAGSAGVNFISASGSEFVEMYVGVGAKRVRELFKKAREHAPCIIFIDEIDAIGKSRSGGNGGDSEREQTLNQFLTEMDGFSGSEGILIVGATNRLDMLDSAFIRAGRFDNKLAVPLPDKTDRLKILQKHVGKKVFSEDVSLERLASKTVGFSGADLEGLLNEAVLSAITNEREIITIEDIDNAWYKIVMKGNKEENRRSESENKLIAYHEAGHALITKLLTNVDVPSVTIIGSTSGAGGVTFRSPQESIVHSKRYLETEIMSMYGGRAAEFILLGSEDEITTGASNDIKQASSLIRSYLGVYGMGDRGLISMEEFGKPSDMIDEAVTLSKRLYEETVKTLQDNKDILDALAEALIKNETLEEPDLDSIVNRKLCA